ncbi:MAG: hypothetical protein IR158_06480 [Cellulomonas sp.]|uniref:hypothetical protein n=1 Tax=Cellulomonas sp. TaxID=40001 RepID=UPI001A0E8C05|nr:hypothetical protein [Cellulomonas sp.]MBF0687400.1 hypothetical protein [Cellulomonas sp.]
MTQHPSQTPEERLHHGARPAPDATSAPSAGRWDPDRWDVDRWRSPVVGALLGVLTLPAVAMVLVGLLVLAVQGVATWLVVAGVALVTTLLGAMGAVVAARGGHPGVVHRLAVLSWVWGVLVVVLAVALALSLESDERVAIAVLLVLGGTYTVVLGLGLWVASRVLPAPVEPTGDDAAEVDDEATPPRGGPTVDDASTQAPAADDDEVLADWPAWGGSGPDPRVGRAPHQGSTEDVVEPAPAARRTSAVPARAERPERPAAPRRTAPTTGPAEPPPPRRTATPEGRSPRRTPPVGDASATELIARQPGDDGPPTERLPPIAP